MCCVLRSSIACALPSALYLSCFASPALSVDAGFFITSSLALHLSRFISLRCVVWRLVSALCLSCFASPALSVDTGFFITSSLALHLSRFILCAVSFGALSLHFAFRALPFVLCLPCVISRRRILHHFVSCTSPFALHFSVLCRLAPCLLHFVSQFLTFHNCAARRALSEPPVSKHHCFRCHASTMPPL